MHNKRNHTYGRLTLADQIDQPRRSFETVQQECRSNHLNRYDVDVLTNQDLAWAVGEQRYDIIRYTEHTFPGRGNDEIDIILPADADTTDTIGFRYTDQTEDIKPDALFAAATEAIEEMHVEDIEYNLMLDI